MNYKSIDINILPEVKHNTCFILRLSDGSLHEGVFDVKNKIFFAMDEEIFVGNELEIIEYLIEDER